MKFYTNISILQRNKKIDKIFYKMDIDKNYFCNNSSGLRGRIIGIISQDLLTGNKSYKYKGNRNEGCFYPDNLEEWYSHMDKKLNDHLESGEHKEGYIDGCVKNGIERFSLLEDENTGIVAGLDTPVWIGNPKADTRIMIVSQDPRRNIKEMAGHSPCISLSSPFGWHDKNWRNNGRTGLLPQICWEIIQNDKNVCFYFTDLYKLRKANTAGKKDNSTVDKKNEKSYLSIIEKEISVFSPTHIVLMGSAVCNTLLYENLVGKKFDKGYFIPKTADNSEIPINPKTSIVPILHIACRQSAIERYKKDKITKKELFEEALKELANNKNIEPVISE